MNEVMGLEDVWLPRIILGAIISWVVIWWRDRLAERRERREDMDKLMDDLARQREEDRAEYRRQREEDRAEDRRQREEDRQNLREVLELQHKEILRRLDAGGIQAGGSSSAPSGGGAGSAASKMSLAASSASSSDSRS